MYQKFGNRGENLNFVHFLLPMGNLTGFVIFGSKWEKKPSGIPMENVRGIREIRKRQRKIYKPAFDYIL